MDILDRYLGYEAWTLRHFISRCQELTTAQLHQPFDIGPGTLHEIISHIIHNLEAWTDLMRKQPQRQLPPMPDTVEGYLARFDAAMADFGDYATTLAAQNRLDDSYVDLLDNPPTRKSYGGTILHVLTHTTVHRWEMQHILQRLGLPDLLEGDALGWEKRHFEQDLSKKG
jgi:uncharacterized damage-inducible protein DinB